MVLCLMLQAEAGKHDKYLNNRGLHVCTANRKCQTFVQIQIVVFSAGGVARSYVWVFYLEDLFDHFLHDSTNACGVCRV